MLTTNMRRRKHITMHDARGITENLTEGKRISAKQLRLCRQILLYESLSELNDTVSDVQFQMKLGRVDAWGCDLRVNLVFGATAEVGVRQVQAACCRDGLDQRPVQRPPAEKPSPVQIADTFFRISRERLLSQTDS